MSKKSGFRRVACAVPAWLVASTLLGGALPATAQLLDRIGYVAWTKTDASPISKASASATSEAPVGFFHQIQRDNPNGAGGLTVSYQKVSDGTDTYLLIKLDNRQATDMAYFNLFDNVERTVSQGDALRMQAKIRVDQAADVVVINSGFHLSDQGNYAGEYAPETAVADNFKPTAIQQLTSDFVGGTVAASTNRSVQQARPRLAVYNIPGGQQVQLRVYGWELSPGTTQGNGVLNLADYGVPQTVAPKRSVQISVNLISKNLSPASQSQVELVRGSTKHVVQLRPVSGSWSATTGRLTDNFFIDLTGKTLAEGDYLVRYRLVPPGASKGQRLSMGSASVKEWALGASSLKDHWYEVGKITVKNGGGVRMGMSLHFYPGKSDGVLPIQGNYSMVRSLASDELCCSDGPFKPWWDVTSTGALDLSAPGWAKLDAWANRFASAGQKKLVLVFFGTPRNASLRPNESLHPWYSPGLIAPPKDLTVLGAAVRESVRRLKGRLHATECWNEPNNSGFFSGTQTQLADHCKTVYQATKAVDSTVPVICPQADTPNGAAFVYSARTSAGEPITQFCDMVGAHIYNKLADDASGKPMADGGLLSDSIRLLKLRSQQYGLNAKPIAVTEAGLDRCSTKPLAWRNPGLTTLDDLSDTDKAAAIRSMLLTYSEQGVRDLVLYSYDHQNNDPTCRRGGSFIWSTNVDANGVQSLNTPVLSAIEQVRSQVGAP